jgi:hypothetical protein
MSHQQADLRGKTQQLLDGHLRGAALLPLVSVAATPALAQWLRRRRASPARSRRARSLWDRAVRTRSTAALRPHHRRPTCQHAGPVKSGVGASIASAWS